MSSRTIILISVLSFLLSVNLNAQEHLLKVNEDMLNRQQGLPLAQAEPWLFQTGHDSFWADPSLNTSDWVTFRPSEITSDLADEQGRIEGWFRIRLKLAESAKSRMIFINRNLWAATDVFINGELIHSFGKTGDMDQDFQAFNPGNSLPVPFFLESGKEYLLALHLVHYVHPLQLRELRLNKKTLTHFINLHASDYHDSAFQKLKANTAFAYGTTGICALLLLFFLLLLWRNPKEKILRYIALLSTLVFVYCLAHYLSTFLTLPFLARTYINVIWSMLGAMFGILTLMIMEIIIDKKIKYLSLLMIIFYPISSAVAHIYNEAAMFTLFNSAMLMYFAYLLFHSRKSFSTELGALIIGMVVNISGFMAWVGLHKYFPALFATTDNWIMSITILSVPISLLIYVFIRFNKTIWEVREKAEKLIQLSDEKKEILANQNIRLEEEVQERTKELNASLDNLKSTQKQLIHSEKMASLGELTAGIAHEIQNPLNFVNNFSDLNKELIEELKEAVAQNDQKEVTEILADLYENEGKINHHGRRAEEIVKSMLQHSRTGSGEKELTDINLLTDEYLRLSYHGLRARNASFNADYKTELDPSLPKVNVITQDMGRVLLNLINNAFQAVTHNPGHPEPVEGSDNGSNNETHRQAQRDTPLVVVSTKLTANSQVLITVKDNGPGIPENIKSKIFQPFFTTKASGEGTGLGLSMSHDIITKGHDGKIEVESEPGIGSVFTITLPIT